MFNDSAHMNFGQEAEIGERISKSKRSFVAVLNTNSYVHHFRGQTLGGCQNGHKDCAQWQIGHRPDQNYHITEYKAPRVAPRTPPWWEPEWGPAKPSRKT